MKAEGGREDVEAKGVDGWRQRHQIRVWERGGLRQCGLWHGGNAYRIFVHFCEIFRELKCALFCVFFSSAGALPLVMEREVAHVHKVWETETPPL